MKRSVAVHIAGQRYVLRSDADDGYVQRVAELVDERFRTVQRTTRQVATHRVAILTALQLADDLLQERQKRSTLRTKVRDRSRRMLDLIVQQLGADV